MGRPHKQTTRGFEGGGGGRDDPKLSHTPKDIAPTKHRPKESKRTYRGFDEMQEKSSPIKRFRKVPQVSEIIQHVLFLDAFLSLRFS